MDWASGDYSQVYADTFLPPASSSGIYVDEHRRRGEGRGDGRGEGRGDRFTSRRGDHARAVYEVAREERPRMSRLVPAWPEAHARPESFTQLSGEKFDRPPADLEYLKVFLLITVVVVLAMIVMATGRLLHGLEKSLKIVVKALAAARAAPGH